MEREEFEALSDAKLHSGESEPDLKRERGRWRIDGSYYDLGHSSFAIFCLVNKGYMQLRDNDTRAQITESGIMALEAFIPRQSAAATKPGKKTKTVHMSNALMPEFTLCGIAEDAYTTGDHPEQVVISTRQIDCPECIRQINSCREAHVNKSAPGVIDG